MMCPAWLYEEMARADTLICGSKTVVDNMFNIMETETERRLNDDFNAPRIGHTLLIPIFSLPVKPKPAGDPTTFDVRWLLIASPDSWSKRYNSLITSALCAWPRAMTSPSLQIPNYLTFGPTQVEEMYPVEFGGHLPITTVMWYFDTHLFYLKQDKSFKPVFVLIDQQPDLVCKIAAIEPDSRMYLLGVTFDNLSDLVNRVQTQLNHVLT